MNYTKKRFGAELILKLEEGYDIEKIAQWADNVHYKHLGEMNDELNDIVQNIASMSFGSQFIYSEQELRDLAVQLIQSN